VPQNMADCLADQLDEKGYHLYGVFSLNESLSRGLVELAFDVAAKRVSDPHLLTLAQALGENMFRGNIRQIRDVKNVSPNEAYVIYAKPERKFRKKGFELIQLHTYIGQILTLHGAAMKRPIQ
jgi:hypothetical protein